MTQHIPHSVWQHRFSARQLKLQETV